VQVLRSILFQADLPITMSCHAGVGISLTEEEADLSRRSLFVVVSFVAVAAVAVVAVAATAVMWGGGCCMVCMR
jgi:hypothetical protein